MSETTRELVESVIGQVVKCAHETDGTIVQMPMHYPSGTRVSIRVQFDGNTCFLSDLGNASREAELLGATNKLFRNQARQVAEQFGVKFDQFSFLELQVLPDEVGAAIRILAGASEKAAVMTEIKMSDQKKANDAQILVDRLSQIFGSEQVIPGAHLKGQSHNSWEFDAQVELSSDQIAVLECVTGNHSSVYSAYTKFSDLSHLKKSPKRFVAINHNARCSEEFLNLLGFDSRSIDLQAPNRRLEGEMEVG